MNLMQFIVFNRLIMLLRMHFYGTEGYNKFKKSTWRYSYLENDIERNVR